MQNVYMYMYIDYGVRDNFNAVVIVITNCLEVHPIAPLILLKIQLGSLWKVLHFQSFSGFCSLSCQRKSTSWRQLPWKLNASPWCMLLDIDLIPKDVCIFT